jgi:outer membrane immunogenic protein
MLRQLVLAGAVLTAAAPVGNAADVGAPPAYDWSGGYVGVHAGYGAVDVDYDFNSNDIFGNLAGETQSEALDGLIGGGQIGYNWQLDNYILGLEGSFTWAGLKETTDDGSDVGDVSFHTGVDWLAALTPRFGLAFDDVLVYGKGGLALADLGTRIEQPIAGGLRVNDDDATEVGWTVGAGAEMALSDNWIIGVEGDYYDFGTYSADKEVSNPPDPPRPGTNYDVDMSLWTILARISYKFGE